ncbi:signal peptide peptidase SppA [Halalkaliarchaeum desulfuricum]|uniref:Signal peptide peptidase SppA n=1 Tax=Halalkaliarchaeum desulfuricum TaxID=2055893 RepID=A0A343TGI7_9EURY|nr:signal peptide peptidase SppA [Halalkaliarchaeum desulfuricum]AUX08209.1 signal peptide peptidase SppA [Halalkaliarchaeum desulfuricum]
MVQTSPRTRSIVGLLVFVVVAAAAIAVGYTVFVWFVESLVDLGGIVLTIVLALVLLRIAAMVVRSTIADYNVAEVSVDGPITRDGGNPNPVARGMGTPADDIVEQIELADADDAVDALMLELNTPGGEVLPSDDIRRAAMEFEGPTVAYATDVCASGGYWIAAGCDELWARDASLVGSIGVISSRVNAAELAEKVGLSYERFAAGKYKDAGVPLKEIDDDEREYLQGLTDDFYESFIERVAEGRELDPEFVRETEARVYLGEEAHELGLVDDLGTRDDVREHVEGLIDATEARVQRFEPQRSLPERIGIGARGVAYALGAGIADRIVGEEPPELRL